LIHIIGDFNSHSRKCGYNKYNACGELVEWWVENQQLRQPYDAGKDGTIFFI